ncbi:MAG: SpoIIE family protein phosphatase [Bacteroidia bacterium]|nr:SpoIIE family protein phosphatase [Bacteroidia bacterium]
MFKKLALNIFLFLTSGLLLSQSHRFKHITSEDGLSTNFVSSILKDDKGFMWFGTQDGLCRYDGYQFKVYKNTNENKSSLSSSDITRIYQHDDGMLYIGTRNSGLNIYNPYKDSFERIKLNADKDGSDELKVNCFLNLDNSTVLIGTDKGIVSFNSKTKESKVVGLTGKKLEIVFLFKFESQIIVATEGWGLWQLTNNNQLKKINLLLPPSLKIDPTEIETINSITEVDGKLFLASHGGGVLKVNPGNFAVEKVFRFDDENNNINFIEDVKVIDSKLLAITRGGGIVLDLKTEKHNLFSKEETNKHSINDNYLTTIFIDEQKNIWLGTFSGGVNVSFSQTQKFPNLPKEISEQFQRTFSAYDDGTDLWIGGEKSLKILNPATNVVKDLSSVIGENYILSMTGDKQGNIWIGTWGVGVFKYNKNSGTKEEFLSSEFGGTVLSLCLDKNQKLWIGSYGDGLFVLDTRTNEVKNYNVADGISSDKITAIYNDKNGNIWLGTDGGGACLIKGGNIGKKESIVKYTLSDSTNSIGSNIVYSVLEDNNSRMWFATSNGLSKYDLAAKKFTNYTEKDGLSNNFVSSVLSDSLNNIWMSTNKGISKFNPNIENVSGSAFKNYDQKDGLLNNEHSQGAYGKLMNGSMLFGGVMGVNIFNPSAIKENNHFPPAYIVSYKRAGKNIETDTAITYKKYLNLSWRENFFQFELAALDYNSPGENKYMYMLEGYDSDWSSPTNVRYVSYTELPGGDYVFKVKAANDDGVWNETPSYIYITVVPPFWKTVWFYIIVSVLGFGGIIVFIQMRTRAVKRENKILENKVAERTKELAEKNADITSSIEYAKRIQEAILPAKDQIFSKFSNAFILYKPKDIVSGDFYWYGNKNGFKIFAVVDCTGHGVPGAFMSMIGHNILNQVVIENGVTDPGKILNGLHKGVQTALKQGQNQVNTNDGMDVSMISVNEATGEVLWAGAFRPVVIVRADGTLDKVDGNKSSVGGAQTSVDRTFTTHTLDLKKQDTIYLYSDGYADQFGGEKGKKYMVKRFNDLLCAIHVYSLSEQQNELEKAFEDWRGNHEQIDDVLVVGIRF